jgi:hypothetical protein
MPHGERGEIAGYAPVAALRAGVQPGQLNECFSWNLGECSRGLAFPGFQQDDFYAASR